MATRSNIGMIQEDGTIKAIYCHWDGYPEGVGQTLSSYYSSIDKVKSLLNLGDISSLYENLEETEKVAYKNRGEDGVEARTYKSVTEWRENALAQWAEFLYLYDLTPGVAGREWNFLEIGNHWKPVPTRLVQTA